jgi:hypothetical protein
MTNRDDNRIPPPAPKVRDMAKATNEQRKKKQAAKKKSREDINQAAFRVVREATEKG